MTLMGDLEQERSRGDEWINSEEEDEEETVQTDPFLFAETLKESSVFVRSTQSGRFCSRKDTEAS